MTMMIMAMALSTYRVVVIVTLLASIPLTGFLLAAQDRRWLRRHRMVASFDAAARERVRAADVERSRWTDEQAAEIVGQHVEGWC